MTTKPPIIPPPAIGFDVDAAIKKQLDKVPDNHSIAVVVSGEKVQGGDARARLAFVLTKTRGEWAISAKTYVEVGEHVKPTVGAEVVFSR